ncbi:MAG TPA: T9SS type A sorting domain-containing protein, partial [Bacteroidales bacterium]|nr:T9SS type A sorting domain-containing protein [Bacteroidales bacterium]
WNSPTAPVTITMSWQQPPINDFDHFNIYMNEGSGFELLGETIGTQVFYTTNNTDSTLFYVTTVDKAGQESEPSENMIFDVALNINEAMGSQFFNIYPNPSGNITNINCKIVESGFYSIRIFDLNGRLIQTLWEGDLQSGDHFFRWNGKNDNAVELTKGIYLINIKGGNVDITKKLIKL